ncbi:MAG TPA: hypothetical protein VFI20_05520, partial [Terracidiphilus sp.]|nr:hypothetical protein [Terracidiphilus sp.]
GIFAAGAADEGSRGPVGLGGNTTGIHNDDISSLGAALDKTSVAQAAGNGLAICPRSAATEVFHMK